MKKAKVSSLDVEELACHILDVDYDEIDGDTSTIQDKLYDEFGCDIDQFTDIISRLLPLVDVGMNPLTKKRYKGFSDTENGMWFTKIEVGS